MPERNLRFAPGGSRRAGFHPCLDPHSEPYMHIPHGGKTLCIFSDQAGFPALSGSGAKPQICRSGERAAQKIVENKEYFNLLSGLVAHAVLRLGDNFSMSDERICVSMPLKTESRYSRVGGGVCNSPLSQAAGVLPTACGCAYFHGSGARPGYGHYIRATTKAGLTLDARGVGTPDHRL